MASAVATPMESPLVISPLVAALLVAALLVVAFPAGVLPVATLTACHKWGFLSLPSFSYEFSRTLLLNLLHVVSS